MLKGMSCFGDCIKASAPGNENSLRNFINKINKTKSLNNSKKRALVKILENPPANYKKNTLTRIANILKPYATNNETISKLLIPYMNKPNNTRRNANNNSGRLNPLTVVNNTRSRNKIQGIAFLQPSQLPPNFRPPREKGLPPRTPLRGPPLPRRAPLPPQIPVAPERRPYNSENSGERPPIQETIEWFREYSSGNIKKHLQGMGYPEEEIAEALSEA